MQDQSDDDDENVVDDGTKSTHNATMKQEPIKLKKMMNNKKKGMIC